MLQNPTAIRRESINIDINKEALLIALVAHSIARVMKLEAKVIWIWCGNVTVKSTMTIPLASTARLNRSLPNLLDGNRA